MAFIFAESNSFRRRCDIKELKKFLTPVPRVLPPKNASPERELPEANI